MSQIIDIRPALGEGRVAELTAPPDLKTTLFVARFA